MQSLRTRLNENKIRPRKSLGQHFVIDPRVIQKMIARARLEREDVVIEIGAGLGILTDALAQSVQKVYALEIDPRLTEILSRRYAQQEGIEIVPGDALEFDFQAAGRKWNRKMKVVANLPYEISSPMIFRLLEERKYFSLLVLMLQKEVARRLVAERGTKDYGPLSVWSQLYTRPSLAFSIPPGAFHPRPRVDSAVVVFEVLEKPSVEVEDEGILKRLIRSAFGYRRKTLVNALLMGEFAHLTREQISAVLADLGLHPEVRGEKLSLEQFCQVARAISSMDR